jgi:stage III sporulation protein SpoIIIAA
MLSLPSLANLPHLSLEESRRLLEVLPLSLQQAVLPHLARVENIFLEVGRPLRLHDGSRTHLFPLTIEYEAHYLGITTRLIGHSFKSNQRMGIPGTYHRLARKLDDQLLPMGLTLRVGRYVPGAADPLLPHLSPHKNLLLLGPPGSGKTTLLRDIAHHYGQPERLGPLLVVVDTSNEIGGEGRVPMPHLGAAQWMKVPDPRVQAEVVRQAIRNHAPRMLMVDEIGYDGEVAELHAAGRKGIGLVATAHARSLEEALADFHLFPLFGLANPAQPGLVHPPVFQQVAVITPERELWLYPDLTQSIQQFLKGQFPRPQRLARLP